LLSELQEDNLDLAIFHEHGTEDEQVINGYPDVSNPQPSIDNIKRYLRNKIQNVAEKKGDIQQAKENYAKSLGVPLAWMDDALVDSVKRADSIANANQDISLADLAGIHPDARFVMLDACENGSFHMDDYLAGYYPFGNGKTIVCMANSIGVLQDNWSDEMLGLLQNGVRAGNWLRQVAFPETHLFGDPTFAFSSGSNVLNNDIVNNNTNTAIWQKYLQAGDVDTKALSLAQLYRIQHKGAAALLKQQYFSASAGAVRLEALLLLNKCNTPDYYEVLKAAVNDPYELIRRQAARLIGDAGNDDLVPALVELTMTNKNNARVMAAVRSSLSFMNIAAVLAAVDSQSKLANDARNTQKKQDSDMLVTLDPKAPLKERYFNITTLRNYNYHSLVPQVIKLAEDKTDNEKLRVAAVEALSWFTHSYQRAAILQMCEVLSQNENLSIKDQALRTKQILLNF
jgi:HEAT repeat protein